MRLFDVLRDMKNDHICLPSEISRGLFDVSCIRPRLFPQQCSLSNPCYLGWRLGSFHMLRRYAFIVLDRRKAIPEVCGESSYGPREPD